MKFLIDSKRFSAITKTLLCGLTTLRRQKDYKAFFHLGIRDPMQMFEQSFFLEFKIVLSRSQIIGFARKHVLCLQEDLLRRNGIPILYLWMCKISRLQFLVFPFQNFSYKIYLKALQEEFQHLLSGKIQIFLRTKNSIWVSFIPEPRFQNLDS